MLASFISRKIFKTEAIAPDRVCTRRHDAELYEKDGEVNMHRQHLGAILASRWHAEDRRRKRRTECGESARLTMQHAAAAEAESFSYVKVPPYPKEV
jgi:hypothetical protein